MKTIKDIEIEVMVVHNLFWESYANRDIELRFSLCSEDVTFIGSGLHERALNKTEYKNINVEGVKQFPDPFQIEFLWTNLTMLNEDVACVESEVVWSQLINNEVAKELLRNTTIIKYNNNKWLVTHVHGSVPDYRLKVGDYMTNEQTIIRNKELERQVFERTQDLNKTLEELEQKNRELEIETALERVRAVAMGMKDPADMLVVCESISNQLQSLGVKEIRNVQTAIFYEQRGTYMNYEYYAKHDKTFITETVFTDSEIHNEFAAKMIKGKGEIYTIHVNGSEVKDWIAYQKTTNVFIDKYLETASSLNYYWFSLGPVALGISTYHPLTEEEIDLFKRFVKVFELAYRRYLDIEKAIAQAREAQIELALERVRARTMAMQKSEELTDVIQIVYDQFVRLKIKVDHAGFVVDYTPKGDWHFWIADERDIPSKITHPYFESVWANQFNEAKEKGADFFATNLTFEEKNKFYNELLSYVPGLPEASKDFYLSCPGLAASTVLMENVGLYIENFSGFPYSDEENNTLMRFGKVFQQTYTRFLDLQKAEAQARESQIEAALERVRSKAMAMHSSDDLATTVDTFFSELNNLKVTPHRCGMGIIDEPSKIVSIHATTVTHDNEIKKIKGNLKLAGHPVLDSIFDNWKLQKEYHPVLRGNEILDYYKVMNPQVSFPDFAGDEIQYGYYFFFKEGGVFAWTDKELADGDLQIFRRYTSVLSLTYRRYKDLKEAEAQAREAEIELSLERVRSRAMAMHSPNDLSETVNVFFKELKTLDIIPIRCGVGQIDEATRTTSLTTTTSSQQGDSFQVIGKVKQTGHPVLDGIFDHWKLQKEYHPVLEGEDIKAYYNVMNAQIGYPEYPEGVTQYGNNFFFKEGFVFAWTENLLSEEDLVIFRRFTTVLSLTYRRYKDLKNAEAQAGEAKIEVALERVRSRTMAMQRSDELAETVSVLFKQLLDLGVKSTQLRTCGIATFKENEPLGEIWITDITGEIISDSFDAPYDEAPAYKTIYSKWKTGEKFLELNLKGDEFLEHLSFVKKYSAVPNINLDEIKKLYKEIFFYVIYFSQGYLFIISYEALTEYHEIFKRFGALFHQTYTRFLDFKKVEAQNKIIQAENERKTKELEDARQLQLAMLPKELPQLQHLDIVVYMKTATEVGGDYYDFNVDTDGTLTVLVGDATGHGMMSGMMVSIMKSFFISNRSNLELKRFFENSNNSIKDMHLGRLMMASMGVQITSEKVIATNAGMPSLLYFRNKSKKAGEFVSNNLPLGGMKGTKYLLKEVYYETGDTLLLMSDGLAELKNEKDEQYGYERVKEEFRSVAQKSPKEIVDHLKNSAAQWINGIEPDDDVTFVVIKVK